MFSVEPVDVPPVASKYRRITTGIPAPGTREVLERLHAVESRSMHGQLPIVWEHARDFTITDIAGNNFIDFTSSIFIANVGHSNPRVSDAVRQQLDLDLYSTYAYANTVRAEYLERLIAFAGAPFEKAFLLSAGTEATEAALKLMRMHGRRTGRSRGVVVCIEGNWHGRTLGAQMLSNNERQREWIGYADPNIVHVPFPYPWDVSEGDGAAHWDSCLRVLEDAGVDPSRDVCGVLLETFQGWGAIFYPADFVKAVRSYCDAHDALLTFDEMQSGFARTGRAFGYEHYGVHADLLCCGKGMGGGVPLSGVVGRADVMDLPDVGNMSSTHSANPLVCAAGLAVLEEIEHRELIEESERKGDILANGLGSLCAVAPGNLTHHSGRGLIASLVFSDADNQPDAATASRVAEACMREGLLVVHTGRESIKIGPPLTISDEALLEGIDVLRGAVADAVGMA